MAVNAQTYYALRQTVIEALNRGNPDTISEETWDYIVDKSETLNAWYQLKGLVEAIQIADISYTNGKATDEETTTIQTNNGHVNFPSAWLRKQHNKQLAGQNGK